MPRLFAATILTGWTALLFSQPYTMPAEDALHEGTWLQWPHQYEYGLSYRSSLDTTWVAMARALVESENVHIIAYDSAEQLRIATLLASLSVNTAKVDFSVFKTNDVWVRDNGPVFVRDAAGNLLIEDWGFNGWGGKFNYVLDNAVPAEVAKAVAFPVLNLDSIMTVEGGAYMLDGNGTLIACKSSILSQTPANTVRNTGMNQAQAEAILAAKLGVTKFIWLNGATGFDITDMHVDGFVQFANDSTIVSMNQNDLLYWQLPVADIATLYNASDINNRPYNFVYLPLSKNNVITTKGKNLGYKGSYCNYYIANAVVLVPNYNDPNDTVANNIIQGLYPDKTVIGIDVRNLYENGGMVHCVTQQQPVSLTTGIKLLPVGIGKLQISPNPTSGQFTITLPNNQTNYPMEIYNVLGEKIEQVVLSGGQNTINLSKQAAGMYFVNVRTEEGMVAGKVMVVK